MSKNLNFNNTFDALVGNAHVIALSNLLNKHAEIHTELEKAKSEEYKKLWILKHCYNNNVTAYRSSGEWDAEKSREMWEIYVNSLKFDEQMIVTLIKAEEESLKMYIPNPNDLSPSFAKN